MRELIKILISVIVALITGFIITLLDRAGLITYGVLAYGFADNVEGFRILVASMAGILFYLLCSHFVVKSIMKRLFAFEEMVSKVRASEFFAGLLGCVIGLIIVNLLGVPLYSLSYAGSLTLLVLNILFAYFGARIARNKKDELLNPSSIRDKAASGRSKILDTSVIIDGRIADILRTGFIEGNIIIPSFVLKELRHIADSPDSIKRNRGRRGLDILNEIQSQVNAPVEIIEWSRTEEVEVDVMLLKMAEELNAFIVTNDYNLNKVAAFQKVDVLNINELSNAIKSVLLPGEEMMVAIVKEGKEAGQGIGYLSDGTMIVVEGGRKFISETINVIVTSALQTAAGRMVFAKTKEDLT